MTAALKPCLLWLILPVVALALLATQVVAAPADAASGQNAKQRAAKKRQAAKAKRFCSRSRRLSRSRSQRVRRLYARRCGRRRPSSRSVRRIKDRTPPETSLTSGPFGVTNSTSVSFGFSSNEPGSSFECRLDWGTWSACVSPKAYSGLAVGSHGFAVRARDAAGNVDASPAGRGFSVQAQATPDPAPAGPRTVVTGAYIPDPRYISAGDWQLRLNQYDETAGRRPSVVMTYSDFSDSFPAAYADAVTARGQTPFITYETSASQYTASAIASGSFDAQLRNWAQGAKAWGKPLYVRFLCEANGDWNSWSPGVGGNTAAQYVAAYRHIHDVFTSVGATNVKFAWTPINNYPGSTPLRSIYPGDAYVDLVGIDGFNWGTTHPSGWETFTQVFNSSLADIRTFTAKPIWITEAGSTELGGDKAAWIAQMFQAIQNDSRISGLIWFNANKETDWRINSSPAALAAWRSGIASTLFSSVSQGAQ